MHLEQVGDVNDPNLTFELTPSDIELFSPNTGNCPIFRTRRDAALAKAAYRRIPVLINERKADGNTWGIAIRRVFNMGIPEVVDQCFRPEGADATESLPMYESKLMWGYEHRHATYEGTDEKDRARGNPRDLSESERASADVVVEPRYRIAADAFKLHFRGSRGECDNVV